MASAVRALETYAERKRQVANALASVRIEGLEPSAEARALFEGYSEGRMSAAELDEQLDAYFDRAYGPLRLSGD